MNTHRPHPGKALLFASSLLVAGFLVSAGCQKEEREKTPQLKEVSLRIVGLDPASVYNGGGEEVRVELEHACAFDQLSATLAGTPLRLREVSPGTFGFKVPPAPSLNVPIEAELRLECAAHPNPETHAYAVNVAKKGLLYEPGSIPAPRVVGIRPVGQQADVNEPVALLFSVRMDESTLNENTIVVEELPSNTPQLGSFKVVEEGANSSSVYLSFPEPLAFNREYRVSVRSGAQGVKSAAGKELSGGEDYTWTFQTLAEDEQPKAPSPAPAPLPAGTGFAQSPQYKLQSTTGQAPPPGFKYGKSRRIGGGKVVKGEGEAIEGQKQ